jgi:hypothetical protein
MTKDDFSIVNHYKEVGQFGMSYLAGDLFAGYREVIKALLEARLSDAWWIGRDWLPRNSVFELETKGLKELF